MVNPAQTAVHTSDDVPPQPPAFLESPTPTSSANPSTFQSQRAQGQGAPGVSTHAHHQHHNVPPSSSADLAGWGKGGDRFGGMAQAGLGQPDGSAPQGVEPGVLSDSASTRSTSSGSSDSGSDDEESEEETHQPAIVQMTEADRTKQEKEARKFREGGSQSYNGSTGQGYMRMLHALAQSEGDDSGAPSAKAQRKKKPSLFASTPNPSSVQRPPQAIYNHNGPPIPNSPIEEDAAAAEKNDSPSNPQSFTFPPERAAQSTSLARCPSDQARGPDPSTTPGLESSALSSAPSSRRRPKRRGRTAGGSEDLAKSSIFAIHQPIESARLRASQLASSEIREDDEEESAAVGRPGMERTSTASTAHTSRTDRTIARRERLADKLKDVFGLDEPEDVIAEYPCWLFRSILLQGFLYITTGHLCFYAFLQKKEGATLRSGSLSVRGNKTRRYHKHWFVLKDDVLSWFPSSTDPYFPDGHVDLHYCISVEPSSHHAHHFKVATSNKKWHFSADSEASRDEWVKTLKKVVFRCQNEGESVKIAIPLETIVDVEKSTGLEFAETIRVRVYDADEGYDIDEYWLSYFKDLDGALGKINETLDQFQEMQERMSQRSPPSPVEDTTKTAVADLGETDQVKGVEGERGNKHDAGTEKDEPRHSTSLGKRVSSVLSEKTGLGRSVSRSSKASKASAAPSPRTSSEAPRQPSSTDLARLSLNTKLATVGGSAAISNSTSATPVAGSTATLRPPTEGQDDVVLQGVSPIAMAAAHPLPAPITGGSSSASAAEAGDDAMPGAPPALGATPRSSRSETTSARSAAAPSALAADLAPSQPAPADLPAVGGPEHTYPPEPTPGPPPSNAQPPRRASTLSKILYPAKSSGRKILEVVTHPSLPGRRKAKKEEDAAEAKVVGGPIVEEPEEVEEDGGDGDEKEEGKVEKEFRKTFGMGEREELIESIPAYLFRGLPIYGKVYISTSYFCFKSNVGILNKTKMILPIKDIIGASKHRSYRIGFSGLMVVIKGHEEVFLELNSTDRRDTCLDRLEEQREVVKQRRKDQSAQNEQDQDEAHRELQDLRDLSASKAEDSALDNPHPKSEAVVGQPPIMFSSTTSDFVTFRPEKSLRFTCLTIGSRGDVQPYIALCKGLIAQGHKCKIASHGEYKKWVEGHGIEFSPVGGDPAELMQLMISHDFFTISFMKEAVGRFRGWLDDLLASAWTGCQDTDVLIESPSAIAGFHIAEALRVPYYRAFTMPWSRTRAYPHAFAVPEVHMGGGYNYMTYTMFDQVFWRATSGQVNRWRQETLNIRPTNLEAMQQHKIPFLYNFSPVVIPPPLDWRENIHVTGYWWLDNPDDSKSKKWEPPKELVAFLDEAREKDKKVVFIGFGSIIIPDPLEMTRVVAEAVEKSGVYAIVAKGWSDRASGKGDSEDDKKEQEEREKTENELMDKPFLYNVKSIPHDWLFPRINAAVHHGGAGTTGASLRAGLPTIIKPFFGDQHFYADRVSTLGIGSHIRNFTVDNVSEALTAAVSDEKQIERARLAGEEIRMEDGVATAIECIYRDLEYARSLIPAPSEARKDSGGATVEDVTDEKATDEKAPSAETEATSSAPSKTRSRSPARKNSSPSSAQNESRTTSSDEGWDVMSRGSAADPSQSWEKDSASRASSMTRSYDATTTAVHDKREGEGEVGTAEEEPQTGLTARMLSMLGKGSKAKQ
ncbi:hypothetical protein JCM11641_008313 [Rhodosporidiobolus odoratus]